MQTTLPWGHRGPPWTSRNSWFISSLGLGCRAAVLRGGPQERRKPRVFAGRARSREELAASAAPADARPGGRNPIGQYSCGAAKSARQCLQWGGRTPCSHSTAIDPSAPADTNNARPHTRSPQLPVVQPYNHHRLRPPAVLGKNVSEPVNSKSPRSFKK